LADLLAPLDPSLADQEGLAQEKADIVKLIENYETAAR
jgi:hypothetical protein